MADISHAPCMMIERLPRSNTSLPGKTLLRRKTPATERTLSRDESLKFHLFSLLPPELRLRIWNLNLPTCRLVPLCCGTSSPSHIEQANTPLNAVVGCVSPAPIPVNLYVCAESRAEALKSYSHAFGFARTPGQIMFNPDSDIIYFGPHPGFMAADSQFHTCMSMCDQAELARVRRVAISDSLFWVDDIYRSMTAASLTVDVVRQLAKRMPSLERIIIVFRQEDENNDPNIVTERISRQVQTAIAAVRHQLVSWIPPSWLILPQSHLSGFGG
ncbi:hypothetical protein HIM_04463 [Hirsutella minnesotensis 3608]|uniref:2EXR domain-containing protein n=1 Tax=Hirsutella minnesotensis 3608 TaxID=1043627 RepID=A0A0F8A191_9HYPO|nr:hypothetical protein HIM_04463 [Hirsutella minnesotensis 3608]